LVQWLIMGFWRLALAVLGLQLVVPATSHATGLDWSVALFSDRGEYVGQHEQRAYHPGNATLTTGAATNELWIKVEQASGLGFRIDLAAPSGEQLAVGRYDGAQRVPFQRPGHPGLAISGEGRGCNTVVGSFEIKELVKGPDDSVERLWLLYEHHCEGDPPALFGEVRIGMPPDAGAGAVTPALVRWPRAEIGRPSTRVPVTFVADSATAIDSVALAGPDAERFLVEDDCSGNALEPGEACQVWVEPERLAQAGEFDATLTLTETGGAMHATQLAATAAATLTSMQLWSDWDDWVGMGGTFDVSSEDASFRVGTNGTTLYILPSDYETSVSWHLTFSAPAGERIGPGHYEHVAMWGFPEGPDPGMSVGAGGCNTITGEFTVHELTFDPWSGRVSAADVTFEQHCNGAAAALRGSVRFQASDLATRDFGPLQTHKPPDDPPIDPPVEPPVDPPVNPSVDPPLDPVLPPQGSSPLPSPPSMLPLAPAPAVVAAPSRRFCHSRTFARDHILLGTEIGDRLRGSNAMDLLYARGGDDRVVARAGDDCVNGGPGADTIHGGQGADVLLGGPGTDLLVGGPGRDRINCGPGRDVARAAPGDSVLDCERVIAVAP
jgi:hypothetical protein